MYTVKKSMLPVTSKDVKELIS